MRINIPKNQLEQLYNINKKSIRYIASKFGCSNWVVLNRLEKFNLNVRSQNETKSIIYKGKNNPSYKHGKYTMKKRCKDCNKIISHNAERCHKCANKIIVKKRRQNEIIQHHIYLRENSNKTMILSRKNHALLHNNAYRYLYESQGKKGIDKYLKWFKKEYKIKD